MSRLTRDGTAEPVSRDQILRRERGQGSASFPCSADHEQDWQPYPVDPMDTLAICVTIHTYYMNTQRGQIFYQPVDNFVFPLLYIKARPVAPVVQLVTSKPTDVGK